MRRSLIGHVVGGGVFSQPLLLGFQVFHRFVHLIDLGVQLHKHVIELIDGSLLKRDGFF